MKLLLILRLIFNYPADNTNPGGMPIDAKGKGKYKEKMWQTHRF